ncbi:EAL domain-containing protein [Pelomicrobium sp. G1]|uniref:EAL domain-containing protein n=1 Tax=unclassified Pelomicrobium TaxID=2815318 RepID=UPI003F764780
MAETLAWTRGRRWLKPRAVAVAGFAVMLVLMVELVAMGMARLDELTGRIDHIAYRQGTKMQVTADLLDVTRQRSELLGVLFVDRTLRQQAEPYRRFEALGRRSAQLMDRLEALEQDPARRAALEELLHAGRALQRMHDALAAALQAGQINEALRLRSSQAEPAGRFEELLMGAVATQRAEMLAAMDEALTGARGAYLFLAVLGGGLLVIGALVAVLVIRHIGRAEAALHREKERAEVALHSIAEGVITTDARGSIEVLNAVAEQLTGWRSAEARGLPLDTVYVVLDEETQKPLPHGFGAAAGRTLVTRAAILKARDGRRIPVEEACSPIRGPDGTVTGLVVVFHDVSHVRAMAQRLTWQASHDPLTGLVNRREFERRLAYLLESAKTDGRKHALLYLDLDRFKAVNDTCGHVAGDELLRQLAAVMHVKIRGSDTLARLGGDEFGVLLEACPADQAIRIANGLREIVRDFRFHWKGKTFSLGASIGLVMVDADSGTVADVLAAADASCYAAKEKGGSRVELYQPGTGLTRTPQGDVAMVHQITGALEKGGFRLYRQPIVPVAEGAGCPHYEVLVRMVDESGHLLAPNDFMPAAERFNLLPMVDRWVVTALLDFMTREAENQGAELESSYSINLSGASLNDSTFADFLRRRMETARVPPRRLCFEVTETTAISNLTKASEFMHDLRALGCRFALDDFGVGMSSFAYLKHLPVDFLKIDGSFIRDLATNPVDYAIVEAINRIAHLLGMKTVAEFVTDRVTLEKLRELQVDYAQGDLIGAPEPLAVRVVASPAIAAR